MTTQHSTLPAEALHKGHIRAYTSGTHKADVQLVGSMPHLLPAVRVATDIPAADCVVGREVTVLFFDATNPTDAIVLAVQGALPSGGGGGVTDHGALTGLGDDDHSQYALLAGRSGGQLLKGGTASGQHLTLQSTAHATRGYVRAQDDVQLLSNILRDAAGTARVTLAAASPHLTLAGNVRAGGYLYAYPPAAGVGSYAVKVLYSPTDQSTAYGLDVYLTQKRSAAGGTGIGINGIVEGQAGAASSFNRGLAFSARHNSAYGLSILQGVYMGVQTYGNKGAVYYVMGGYLFGSFGANTPVTASYGMWIRNFGHTQVGTAIGLQIDDQTNATINNIINAGPSTPYLRLLGGANPPANMTNLYLKEQATLRRVQWKDGAAVGAGDRVMVLV